MASRFAQAFTTENKDPKFDLSNYVGQRSSTFRFDLINGITGVRLGTIHPLRDSVPSLDHDTTRTIKRTLSLELGKDDTQSINTITDRVTPYMIFSDGTEYPLGRYMFSDATRQKFTSGKLSSVSLVDESFIIDQEMETSFAAGISGDNFSTNDDVQIGESVDVVIQRLLAPINIPKNFEETGVNVIGNWTLGTSRMRVFEELATQGGFFSPWVDHTGTLRLIRSFEPSEQEVDFDLDISNSVKYSTVAESDDFLTAPNRIIVINNNSNNTPIMGTYDIPSSAPHSVMNRGFVIPNIITMQINSISAAAIAAQNIGIRENVFERVTLITAPDPRFDSYNIIKWDNEKWFELAWSMQLIEGGDMTHTMRKTYLA